MSWAMIPTISRETIQLSTLISATGASSDNLFRKEEVI
jgi:hypothetical protein